MEFHDLYDLHGSNYGHHFRKNGRPATFRLGGAVWQAGEEGQADRLSELTTEGKM